MQNFPCFSGVLHPDVSTKILCSSFLVESFSSIAPPRSSVQDSWWRFHIDPLHQDYPGRNLWWKAFFLSHHQDLPKRDFWWRASCSSTTKISRRENPGGVLPTIAPPKSPEERSLVEKACSRNIHFQTCSRNWRCHIPAPRKAAP